MSEWGIALIAAGSAILGSITTGFFAWKAGHRQAGAAEHAGNRQADALIATVQATLDDQRRARAVDHRRQVYAGMLTAATELHQDPSDQDAHTRALAAHDLVDLEGPRDVARKSLELLALIEGIDGYPPGTHPEVAAARRALIDAANAALLDLEQSGTG